MGKVVFLDIDGTLIDFTSICQRERSLPCRRRETTDIK